MSSWARFCRFGECGRGGLGVEGGRCAVFPPATQPPYTPFFHTRFGRHQHPQRALLMLHSPCVGVRWRWGRVQSDRGGLESSPSPRHARLHACVTALRCCKAIFSVAVQPSPPPPRHCYVFVGPVWGGGGRQDALGQEAVCVWGAAEWTVTHPHPFHLIPPFSPHSNHLYTALMSCRQMSWTNWPVCRTKSKTSAPPRRGP